MGRELTDAIEAEAAKGATRAELIERAHLAIEADERTAAMTSGRAGRIEGPPDAEARRLRRSVVEELVDAVAPAR